MSVGGVLDCLIVGGGPAGLTAALYLARFNRRCILVDNGSPRAAWIPKSHNIPLFPAGLSGLEILSRGKFAAEKCGAHVLAGTVTSLQNGPNMFSATVELSEGGSRDISARRVLLATGAIDIEPKLPGLPNAVQTGLVRYCPICDGYEAMNKKIAVIGYGDSGIGDAIFIARTYSSNVTLLTLGQGIIFNGDERRRIAEHHVEVIEDPIASLEMSDGMITAVRGQSGKEHHFEVLYSALGMKVRSELALSLGAKHDEAGALITGEHNRTSVKGLYAAGDVVRGLSQIVVGMGHAAIAATDIHNRCELPTEEEPQITVTAR